MRLSSKVADRSIKYGVDLSVVYGIKYDAPDPSLD